MRAIGIHPNLRFPDIGFETSIITFFKESPDKLERLREKWTEQCIETNILTPPSFLQNLGSIPEQYEGFLTKGWGGVDVYSSVNRYREMFVFLDCLKKEGLGFAPSAFCEIGAAGGDNLLQLQAFFGKDVKYIGTDVEPLESIVRNSMMRQYRFPTEDEIQAHLRRFQEAGIPFHVLDVFDESNVVEVLGGNKNLCIICTNVLFPHFDEQRLKEGLINILKLNPKYLLIGGGVPMLEQRVNGHWLPGWHLKLFQIHTDGTYDILANSVEGLVKPNGRDI